MVGTSGSTAMRPRAPTPSARSVPDLMYGTVWATDGNVTLVWPPTTLSIDGPPPRNGTCTMSTPAISLNSSPPRCWNVPIPADAYSRSPGFALASVMNSLTEVTGTDGCTTSTLVPWASSATGVKSLMGS